MFERFLAIFTKPIWWALDWVPQLARLHCYDGGVRVSGDRIKVLKPGFYWYVPNVHEVLTDNIVRKVRALEAQTLTTSDRKRVRVGAVLVFRVVDVERWIVHNENPDVSVLVEAERAVRSYVEARYFRAIVDDPKDLTALGIEVLENSFGIEVERLTITNFAEVEAIDHSGIELIWKS